jgi:hypothetical protein
MPPICCGADLCYARQEMLRFLTALPDGELVGFYILRSYGFQVVIEPTAHHAQVAARLNQWIPTAQDLARAQDEESRNRQESLAGGQTSGSLRVVIVDRTSGRMGSVTVPAHAVQ